MKIPKLVTALLAVALTACSENSATVEYDGGKVRLTAVSENIIRVEAVPAGAGFSSAESLSVIKQDGDIKTDIRKENGELTLSTGKVTAKVNTATGQVRFFDADGNPVTGEDRREFTPVEVEGTKGWTVRQVFNSDSDEGFYGLGQHQADEWNYKGRNEELYQYNTKISIPFVVSSKKYGILWDSNCFCRWGDPRDYKQLDEVFKLYDRNGAEGALTGTYSPANGEPLVRREKAINQEYLRTPQCDVVRNAPEGFDFNGSHVVFDGCIEASEAGLYHFYMYYAGYTKVFVNGVQVMPDLWRTAWNPNGRKFEYRLDAGEKVSLRIEWEPDGGTSYCALKVLPPVDEQEQGKMSWWGEMQDGIDYYYIAADNVDGVISGYRQLTGKAPILPKWAFGYWQSRERYTSQEEILGVMGEFRRRGIPVDNIVQDWQYWKPDQWGSHEFDESRYPDPKAMVDSIHAMDARYMISVWPKFYEGTGHFKEFDDKGWMYRTSIDEKVIDWLGYSQSFYDAYSADARKLFWKQMYEHLYPLGVDSWWMDASEPNIHDCTDMDYRKKMAGPTAMGPSTKYLNAYALLNAEAIYDGQRSVDPDRRVFLLTRNGFLGLQRYSTASWSGDIGTTWLDMKAQISAGLNYCISGLPFWGQDVGGFTSETRFQKAQNLFDATGTVNEDMKEWRELNARWHQWGIFCPLYRAHGQYPFREPWNIAPEGSETYNAILAADRMRYRLMPYIYTLASKVYFEDYTMMRPLVMDFTDDDYAREISDQFMFGDAIMVCPVYEYGARERDVYLPAGGWYDLSDGRFVNGGSFFTAAAPYDRTPLFARAGSIIVTGDEIRSTADIQKELCINVFEGKDAEFGLYTDDGLSYDYEKGEYARIDITWDNDARCLRLSDVKGRKELMPEYGTFKIRLFTREGITTSSIGYDGKETQVNIGTSGAQIDGTVPALHVNGVRLYQDGSAEPVTWRGLSFGWHNLWPRFYNKDAVSVFAKDWGCPVFRASIGADDLQESSHLDGYISNPESALECLYEVIDGAIENNAYVIVDWHSHILHQEEAEKFFRTVATKYAGCPNVIYELFNEPVSQEFEDRGDYAEPSQESLDAYWARLKEYALALIPVIEECSGGHPLILMGCPRWDQALDCVIRNPIEGYDNLMYTAHFYAATHGQWLRDRSDAALAAGLPVFISECAACEASGDGPVNPKEWEEWNKWAAERNISLITWSISDKNETCSMFSPKASSEGPWDDHVIKEWGLICRDWLKQY